MAVSITAGQTAFTRMPSAASSFDSVFDMAETDDRTTFESARFATGSPS